MSRINGKVLNAGIDLKTCKNVCGECFFFLQRDYDGGICGNAEKKRHSDNPIFVGLEEKVTSHIWDKTEKNFIELPCVHFEQKDDIFKTFQNRVNGISTLSVEPFKRVFCVQQTIHRITCIKSAGIINIEECESCFEKQHFGEC